MYKNELEELKISGWQKVLEQISPVKVYESYGRKKYVRELITKTINTQFSIFAAFTHFTSLPCCQDKFCNMLLLFVIVTIVMIIRIIQQTLHTKISIICSRLKSTAIPNNVPLPAIGVHIGRSSLFRSAFRYVMAGRRGWD